MTVPRKPFAREIWKEVDFDSSFIGFKEMFEAISGGTMTPSTYPPHNVRKYQDNSWVIEVATAGFSKEELEVSLKNNRLTIKGKRLESDDDSGWVHKGIARRDFEMTFKIVNGVEVKESYYKDGLLAIRLHLVIPEEEKPKLIEIK